MNKRTYTCIKFFLCSLAMLLPLTAADAEIHNTNVNIGRANPFGLLELPKKKTTAEIPKKITKKTPEEPKKTTKPKKPELFIKTITLKAINAKSLTKAVQSMCSQYGSISIDEKNNTLIICDTKKNLRKILAQIHEADEMVLPQIPKPKPKPVVLPKKPPELLLETITLKFLDAKNLKNAIKELSSDRGSISIDTKTNSIIVCDTKENLEQILKKIRKADKTPEQIMVEVVIVDVRLENETEIGINWDLLSDKNYDLAYKQNLATRLGSTIKDATTVGNATAFNTTGIGGDFSIISGTIRHVLHLVQQKRDVEILASPRVMMVSGQSAFIEAVEEIPYSEVSQTSAGGELTSTKFKNVGISLKVSAILADSNNILLEVTASQSVRTGESVDGIPVVDNRTAQASLLLKDGQIVIIGGLRRQEKITEVDSIPFLSELPIIGGLFKSTNDVVNNSELIVFLAPHIYTGKTLSQEQLRKFNEIKSVQNFKFQRRRATDQELLAVLSLDDLIKN